MKHVFTSGVVVSFLLSSGFAVANPGHGDEGAADHDVISMQLIMPRMNAELGRKLFASKGCVACHSVNDVGSEDASSLDAHDMELCMNPFDLAARMWRMAPYMIAAQEEAFGEQIQFTDDELSAEVLEMMHHEHSGEAGENAHSDELDHY